MPTASGQRLAARVVRVDETFSDGERLALLGFLAAYQGATREAYACDLRQLTASVNPRRVEGWA